MPVIIGLGNPGSKYAGTRHNVGFELLDRLAAQLSVSLGPGKGPFHMGSGIYKREKVILVKPTTFMNLSGDAVQQVLHYYKIDPQECLVCYDDLDLQIGDIRLRAKGSAGGHNGIKDIILKLGTDVFPRLRIGIGNDFPKGQQVNYVLSRFNSQEKKIMDETLDTAVNAALSFVTEGIEETMNSFN
ncbi:MAG: aminoacyl-tRNA hydrolase [Candidatus Halalkalibacterium sp. M3_1C_030]